MQKLFVCFLVLFSLSSFGQSQSSLNYFYNLSYFNPAFSSTNNYQFDLNSTSWFNAMPLGIYSVGVNGLYKSKKNIGGSFGFNNLIIGKNQTQTSLNLFLNYDLEINFTNRLSFGVGIKSQAQKIDETGLTTALNTTDFSYTYGESMERNSSILLPIGVEFSNKSIISGAYFSAALNASSQFGAYLKLLTFESSIKKLDIKNYTGLSISKEILNPKIALSNSFFIDNYAFDLFGNYNIGNSISNLLSLGAGIHYHWKVYDFNYQLSANNQHLGMSHQIGIQLFY